MTEHCVMLFQATDVLSFRDGRPFNAGAAFTPSAQSVFPSPSTMFGAVTDILGGFPVAVRGPMLAMPNTHGEHESWLPIPVDVVPVPEKLGQPAQPNQQWTRLRWALDDIDQRPGVETETGIVAGPIDEGSTPPGMYMRTAAMNSYLAGAVPFIRDSSLKAITRQTQTGLARGHEGMLYEASMLRLDASQQIAVLVETNEPVPRGVVSGRLGGRGRPVNVDVANVDELALPKCGLGPDDDNVILSVTLVTPGLFRNGWIPPRPDGGTLIGAATGSPVAMSRMQSGRGQKRGSQSSLPEWRVDWAVPPGSTYVYRFSAPAHAQRFADKLHLRCLKPDYKPQRSQGFGLCLIGKAGQ